MKLKKVKMLLLAGAVMSMCIGTTAFAKVTNSNSIVDTNKGYAISIPSGEGDEIEEVTENDGVSEKSCITVESLDSSKKVTGELKISNTEDGTFDGKFKTRSVTDNNTTTRVLLKTDDTADYKLLYKKDAVQTKAESSFGEKDSELYVSGSAIAIESGINNNNSGVPNYCYFGVERINNGLQGVEENKVCEYNDLITFSIDNVNVTDI